MSEFTIKIDDYEFKLLSKSAIVETEKNYYHKVEISSLNINTNEQTHFFAYISQSGTVWRFCSKRDSGSGSLLKYGKYIQDTILDFRLQAFIFSKYNTLPVNQNEITCEYTDEKIDEFLKEISSRGIDFYDLLYIINENTKKNIFDAYIRTLPDGTDTSKYTSKTFYEKYGIPEIEMYKSLVMEVVGYLLHGREKEYEQYKIANRYENVPIKSYTGLSANVSFNFDKSWFDKNNRIELQDYLKRHFDIIDEFNNPIVLGVNPIPKKLIMEYELDFSFGKFTNKYYGVKLRHKQNSNIIVVHIGKITLNLKDKPIYKFQSTRFSGYHICNIVDENVKITKYGLYHTYYTEPNYEEIGGRGRPVTNFIDKYITKPLEYPDQINNEYCIGQPMYSTPYFFMCVCNEEKYLIRELLDEEEKLSEQTFKIKYLKYKQKYIKLKKQLN